MQGLSVQWLTSDPGLLELDWLQLLLPDAMKRVQVHASAEQVQLDKRVLLITNSVCSYREVLERFRTFGTRYGIVLLSDEYLQDPCEWLVDPQCVFLARNYAHPSFLHHPKVFTFGLGYTRGFSARKDLFKPLEQRELAWCFAGTPHGDRIDALKLFSPLQPHRVHTSSGFMSADGLGQEAYATLLGNSIFSLCPPGHSSNDTYRLYESLEAGCIPVAISNSSQCSILPSYWHSIFRSHSSMPFIVGKSYQECFSCVLDVLSSNNIHSIQSDCMNLWSATKRSYANHFADLLSAL
jgi:hypothetical protein